MITITLDEMLADLRAGEVSISFEKLNGDIRYGNFTLSPSIIPNQEEQKAKSRLQEKIEKGDEITSLNVWEATSEGWRSFVLANVKDWNGKDVTYAGS